MPTAVRPGDPLHPAWCFSILRCRVTISNRQPHALVPRGPTQTCAWHEAPRSRGFLTTPLWVLFRRVPDSPPSLYLLCKLLPALLGCERLGSHLLIKSSELTVCSLSLSLSLRAWGTSTALGMSAWGPEWQGQQACWCSPSATRAPRVTRAHCAQAWGLKAHHFRLLLPAQPTKQAPGPADSWVKNFNIQVTVSAHRRQPLQERPGRASAWEPRAGVMGCRRQVPK